jgi:hypothetical protein
MRAAAFAPAAHAIYKSPNGMKQAPFRIIVGFENDVIPVSRNSLEILGNADL